jgi:cyanophycinase
VSFSSADSASEGQPVAVLGLKVHVLVAGTTFDLNARTASAAKLVPSKE